MAHKTPLEPLLLVDLLPEMRAELLRILEGLPDAAWDQPTVCEGWTVRDVVGHLLGDDVGLLSNLRDHDGQHFKVGGWEELVALINAQNDLWVKAARRISRRLVIELLRFTGQQVYEHFQTIDPHQLGGPIGWAGDQPDPMWLHIAREVTEYWAHHQHICEAVGITSLKDARFTRAVLSTYVRALPRTYQQVAAPDETLIKLVIEGEGGGTYHLVREANRWVLYANTDLYPACIVTLDSDTAWRLFTRNRPIAQLQQHIVIEGDSALGQAVWDTIAIIA